MTTATPDKDGFIPQDYVFTGKRIDSKDKPFVCIKPINEDGTLGDDCWYEYKKKRDKVVGGVYTGASFKGGTIRGLDEARFTKQWHNREDRMAWQAKDEEAEVEMRNAKLEKDAGRISEIEKVMLPIRKTYENMRFRKDYAGMEALEKAVLRALRSAPRVIE